MISIRGVTFSYSGSNKPAIKDIDLNVEQGEFLLVTGPTGGGKSTLLRLFNGLIPRFYTGRFTGDVIIGGMNTKSTEVSHISATVAMVFQSPEDQMVGATVERDVAFACENRCMAPEELRRRVDMALLELGIDGIRKRPPEEISGGEKQLVAVASAVASGAHVLVLDEPTAELDAESAGILFVLLRKLHEEGMTVVVAEHRLEGLLPIASRAVVLDGGQVVADIGPRELVEPRFERMGIGLPAASRVALALRRRGVAAGQPVNNGELMSILAGAGVELPKKAK